MRRILLATGEEPFRVGISGVSAKSTPARSAFKRESGPTCCTVRTWSAPPLVSDLSRVIKLQVVVGLER